MDANDEGLTLLDILKKFQNQKYKKHKDCRKFKYKETEKRRFLTYSNY